MSLKHVKVLPDHQTARTAAKYVARLYSGVMTEAEAAELEDWLRAGAGHQQEFDRALETWDVLEPLAGDTDIVNISEGIDEDALSRRGTARLWYGVAASLVLMLAALGAFIGLDRDAAPEVMARYETAVGEQRSVALQDGSTVMLNTNSSILVDFSGADRKAFLDRGEAFFDIARDPSRPFVVEAGTQSITVLGTKFNVQKIGTEFTVAVVEGVVAVHKKDVPLRIGPAAPPAAAANADPKVVKIADQYRLEAGGVLTFKDQTPLMSAVTGRDIDRYQDWRRGVVTFDQAHLKDVVAEINRYSQKRILINDAAIMDLEISGVFHLSELDGMLAGMESAFPIRFSYVDDMILLEGRPGE